MGTFRDRITCSAAPPSEKALGWAWGGSSPTLPPTRPVTVSKSHDLPGPPPHPRKGWTGPIRSLYYHKHNMSLWSESCWWHILQNIVPKNLLLAHFSSNECNDHTVFLCRWTCRDNSLAPANWGLKQIYNYTTPLNHMQKETENAGSFKDIIGSASDTHLSLPLSFSLSWIKKKKKINEHFRVRKNMKLYQSTSTWLINMRYLLYQGNCWLYLFYCGNDANEVIGGQSTKHLHYSRDYMTASRSYLGKKYSAIESALLGKF